MNYEQMIKETDEMIRRIMIRNQVVSAVLIALCVVLIVLVAIMVYQDTRERKARRNAKWGQYRPTITETVQVDQFGTVYHRMGTPTEEG